MKSVLAYGDSLTWGYMPETGGRHPHEMRWPSALERALDGQARIISEGLSGRTTSFDDHASPADLNGARVLPTLLASHAPLDAVVIMLGTNDLKPHLCGHAIGAALGMRRLVEIVTTYPFKPGMPRPRLLLVAPPPITQARQASMLSSLREAGPESQKLAPLYRQVAQDAGCGFFDAGGVAATDPADGVHLDATNSLAIGNALIPVIRAMLDLQDGTPPTKPGWT